MTFLNADTKSFFHIVDSIYDAALFPDRWPNVLGQIANWLGATKGLLITPTHTPELGGFHFSFGILASTLHEWRTRHAPDDMWANAGIRGGLFIQSKVVLGTELVPRDAIINSAWYANFLLPADIEHMLSGVVYGSETAGTPPVVCSLFRGPGMDDFSIDHRERLAELIPHLSRGVGVMIKLNSLQRSGALSNAVLDELQFGVIVADADARLITANLYARQLLNRCAGLTVTRSGVLVADGSSNTTLRHLISLSAKPSVGSPGHFSSVLKVPVGSGGRSYTLQFSSITLEAARNIGVANAALIFLSDSSDSAVPSDTDLQAAFDLTPAEARVARVAIEIDSVNEIAAQLSISVNTVKTHLKSIYAKTEATSRSQFVRRVLAAFNK